MVVQRRGGFRAALYGTRASLTARRGSNHPSRDHRVRARQRSIAHLTPSAALVEDARGEHELFRGHHGAERSTRGWVVADLGLDRARQRRLEYGCTEELPVDTATELGQLVPARRELGHRGKQLCDVRRGRLGPDDGAIADNGSELRQSSPCTDQTQPERGSGAKDAPEGSARIERTGCSESSLKQVDT